MILILVSIFKNLPTFNQRTPNTNSFFLILAISFLILYNHIFLKNIKSKIPVFAFLPFSLSFTPHSMAFTFPFILFYPLFPFGKLSSSKTSSSLLFDDFPCLLLNAWLTIYMSRNHCFLNMSNIYIIQLYTKKRGSKFFNECICEADEFLRSPHKSI